MRLVCGSPGDFLLVIFTKKAIIGAGILHGRKQKRETNSIYGGGKSAACIIKLALDWRLGLALGKRSFTAFKASYRGGGGKS